MSEIKRYDFWLDGFDGLNKSEEPDGEYVKYEDHERLLQAEREKNEALRQAIRELAREWEADAATGLPGGTLREAAAELRQLEKEHAD